MQGEQSQHDTAAALLAILDTPGLGRAAAWRFVALARREQRTPPELICLGAEALLAQGADASDVMRLDGWERRYQDALASLDKTRAANVSVVSGCDPSYPRSLCACLGNAAPPVLFLSGKPSLIGAPAAGIVGGRRPEASAITVARACARALVSEDAVVVSGGARGVDTCAHEAALAAGGRTIVVLPQGLLDYAPSDRIAEGFADGRVLLLSEFTPNAPWSTPAAVTRNGTISALGTMLCLIAPRRQGGSVATARWTLSAGKPVGHAFADRARTLLDGAHHAFPLLDASGRLDITRLRQAWCEASKRPFGEPGLFDGPW